MSQNTSNKPYVLTNEDRRRIVAEESAILGFTEEVLRRLAEVKMSKSDLDSKMNVDPAAVSKLISGNNNFTLRTMVRIARALRSRIRFSLVPLRPTSAWTVLITPDFEVKSEPSFNYRVGSYTHTIYDNAVSIRA